MSNYYNESGKKLQIGNLDYLKSGACSDCLTDGKIVLKKYKDDVESHYRISPDMFETLKTVDDDEHFIKLYDIYSSLNLPEAFFRKIGIGEFYPDAYTSKYYQEENINVLEEDKSYLLENIADLEKVVTDLATKQVGVNDLRRANVITNSNCITIIDPDLFYFSSSSQNRLIACNKILLLDLISQLLLDSAEKETDYKDIGFSIIGCIETFDMNCNTDLGYEFSKKLSNVKKPIDYFRN